jgi:rubrerythrin
MTLKGTETEKNLLKAFAGESQARNRYTFFASQAVKEGYQQISGIFIETADHEKEHATRFFKFLEGGDTEIVATYPAGKIGTTVENLIAAANGEAEEWGKLYPAFASAAREEGFEQVATVFEEIGEVEAHHEIRYRKLAKNIQDGSVFKKATAVAWKCRNCGYVHEGTEAPALCPACAHPQAYYEVFVENY